MNEGNVSSALDVEDASVILVCWRGDVHGLGWCTCGLRETLVGQARVGVDTFPSVGGEGEGHEGHGWDGTALFCNAKRFIINQPRDPGCHKQQMCLA